MTAYTLAEALGIVERTVPGVGATVSGSVKDQPEADCASADGARPPMAYRYPAPSDQNQACIAALVAHWSRAYPEAGRAYWSLRCWGILIWKPIYVSVIAVHRAHCLPSLAGFEQTFAEGWTHTARYPAHRPVQGIPTDLIEQAAADINRFCASALEALSRSIRINVRAAQGMQADCVLAALLAAQPASGEGGATTEIEALCARWLAALHLDGRSGFFAYRGRDGIPTLEVDRQTCCYHFRRHDGVRCHTCPRLTLAERIARQDGTPLDAACDHPVQ
ncbi:siderophore ferric iron reductase [Robbsia sp. KACC 23696]|uniref:siderophore ferric iron reductase n=1 Tax=Robbsia sp. KACC 23696 TaxID=3149231 RepID=UPI00325B0C78